MSSSVKIGLALSGGGAKGIMHIGVLRALLENNIKPEIVSGTSAGSIVGAAYTAGYLPDDIEKMMGNTTWFKILRSVRMPGVGMIKMDYLHSRLQDVIPRDNFDALEIPFYVCATNLNAGTAVIFNEGTLFDKVMASCAVPWLFKPILIDGQMYADGGITNNLPAKAIRDKCDILIGSNVKPKVRIDNNKELDSWMGITQRCFELAMWSSVKQNVKVLDVYIAPEKVLDMSVFEIRRTKEMIEIGYEETLLHIDEIHTLIKQKHKEKAHENMAKTLNHHFDELSVEKK